MENSNNEKGCCQDYKKCHCGNNNCASNAIYGLGLIGSLVYFLQNSHNFGAILLGIGKAIIWPAILIFKFLSLLKL